MGRRGIRKVRRAILSMGRKNGKTALIAALVLVHLIGPEAVQNGEIYSAANDTNQAGIIFKFCAQLVEASPKLKPRLGIIAGTKRIVAYGNGSFYAALSRESKSKHGYNPTCVVYDELAQSIGRDLFDALDTSQGAREESIFFVISTQSRDPGHVLSELIDDGLSANDPTTVCHLYTVPEETENIFSPKCWAIANPALGDFRLMEDFIAKASRAERRPSFENAFRNLYLNQRVSTTSPLISPADWRACGQRINFNKGEGIYGGLDLSARTDLCSFVTVTQNEGERVESYFWKPEAMLDDHQTRDRVPYVDWARSEFIIAPPGKVIDYRYVAITLQEVAYEYNLLGVAFDRWRIFDLEKAAEEQGIAVWIDKGDEATKKRPPPGIRLVPWGQGFKDMAPAIDAFEEGVLNKTLLHDNNPVLSWCIGNAEVQTDPAGNRKLIKDKARFRIDGAVALAMACGLKARDAIAPPKPVSIYSKSELWSHDV